MTDSPSIAYRPRGRYVVRHIGEDHLLVPVSGDVAKTNCVYPLNETGALLWICFERGDSLDAAAVEVARAFVVDEAAARADAETFARELAEAGLLEAAS